MEDYKIDFIYELVKEEMSGQELRELKEHIEEQLK